MYDRTKVKIYVTLVLYYIIVVLSDVIYKTLDLFKQYENFVKKKQSSVPSLVDSHFLYIVHFQKSQATLHFFIFC